MGVANKAEQVETKIESIDEMKGEKTSKSRGKLVGHRQTQSHADSLHFALCIAGVFVCYSVYGVIQEYLMQHLSGFTYGWWLTTVQFAVYEVLMRAKREYDDWKALASSSQSVHPMYVRVLVEISKRQVLIYFLNRSRAPIQSHS